MIEFLKNLSNVTSSIIAIIFAFILGKVIGFEEKSETILENIEKKLNEIEELKIDIITLGISVAEYEDTEKEIFDIYFNNYLENRKSPYTKLKKIIKDNELFFITFKDLTEKLKDKEKKFLEDQFQVILTFVRENSYLTEKNIFNEISLKFPISKIIEEKNLEYKTKINQVLNESSFLNQINISRYLPEVNFPKIIENRKSGELKGMFKKYDLKLLSLYMEEKKLNYLKKERRFLSSLLLGLYLVFLLGIIYPMSFVKYHNNDILDLSLNNNFLKELFTFSGFVLFILTSIMTVFLIILQKFLLKKINKKNLNELDEDKDWLLINYLEYKDS